ncbi:MAG: hypothetical protein U0231_10440 [Nitrospiraceae bacterium]
MRERAEEEHPTEAVAVFPVPLDFPVVSLVATGPLSNLDRWLTLYRPVFFRQLSPFMPRIWQPLRHCRILLVLLIWILGTSAWFDLLDLQDDLVRPAERQQVMEAESGTSCEGPPCWRSRL